MGAVAGDDLHVLEYLLTDTHRREEWLPRVRKVARDGSVKLLANVTQDLRRTTEADGGRAK